LLSLTENGRATFDTLGRRALDYDRDLRRLLGPERVRELVAMLQDLAVGRSSPVAAQRSAAAATGSGAAASPDKAEA